jgi:hypothetical protein
MAHQIHEIFLLLAEVLPERAGRDNVGVTWDVERKLTQL